MKNKKQFLPIKTKDVKRYIRYYENWYNTFDKDGYKYVIEAELAQEKAEHAEQQEFKKWKASNKPQAASTIKKTQLNNICEESAEDI